jgi:hypothetical protein
LEGRQRRGELVEGTRGWQKLPKGVAGGGWVVSWKKASKELEKERRIVELGEKVVQASCFELIKAAL